MRVTVQSLADELNLSKFAVSRALSGKSGVSEETRKLVIETAERLGYEPRATRRQQSARLAMVCADRATASRELWIEVRNGIELQAMRSGYEVELVFCDAPEGIARLKSANLGLIMLGPSSRATIEAAQATGLPVVTCGFQIPPLLNIDQVAGTETESGAYVGEYLAALGHRDIVYVHGKAGFPGRIARMRGLQDAIGGTARITEITMAEDYASADFSEAMRALVKAGGSPTAFFCGSDGVAVTIQSELLRLGFRVPRDVSVIGHADYPLATQVSPQLTTIHMPHREIGMHAVRLICQRISDGPVGPNVRIGLVGRLVERESSGPAGKPDWSRLLSTVGTRR